MKTSLGEIEYAEFGSGPAVVSIHGAMGGYDQSVILAQTIGNVGYRFICISRPGYLGTALKVGHSPEQQGDLIAALMDTLGIAQAGVMAVSGGGPSAIQFGLRHSMRCLGLVLVSTCATKVETRIPVTFKVMTQLARWPWFVNRFKKKTERNLEGAAQRSIRDPEVLANLIRDQDAWPLYTIMMLSIYDRMGQRLTGTKNDIEISRTVTYPLENITVPVLIVHGTLDRLVPFRVHAKIFESRVPQVKLMAVDGGEHVAIFTHRAWVKTKVNEFMQGHFSRTKLT